MKKEKELQGDKSSVWGIVLTILCTIMPIVWWFWSLWLMFTLPPDAGIITTMLVWASVIMPVLMLGALLFIVFSSQKRSRKILKEYKEKTAQNHEISLA